MQHPGPDRLALAALPAAPADPPVETHLRACPACRDHVGSLRRTVDLAVAGRGDGGEDADPPGRVWAAIVDGLHPAGPRPRRRAAGAAAALVALVAGFVLGSAAGAAPPAERPIAVLTAVDGAPGPSGSAAAVRVDGQRVVVVRVRGVVVPPGADHLEAWLTDAAGTRLVALGALAPDGDGFRGASALPPDLPAAYVRIDVSAERADGDERHSRTSLLRGPLR